MDAHDLSSHSGRMRRRLKLRGDLERARTAGETVALARELGIAPVTADLMVARGVDVDDPAHRDRVLAPKLKHLRPPKGMAGFEHALELLLAARRNHTRVGVFGDYDVDGVTTTAILTTFLECLGLEVVCRVATRGEGYGFQPSAARALVEAGVELVLTGDCGTSDHEALGWLRARGVPTVVIDHHQVPETMPPAAALINPHQDGCEFGFKGMCSAGVAFYLCAALRTAIRRTEPSADLPDPRAFLDLVALGTVCDMVPLVDVNRIFVHHGLRLLGERRRPGIRAMLQRANVPVSELLDEGHLGFQLGPRLNAPGRLGTADPSLQLLRARSDAEASALAAKVEMFNQKRRAHQDDIVEQAHALLEADPKTPGRKGLVVASERWLAGIVGIAASGIVERYRRPALVCSLDPSLGEGRGSARSYAEIDVRKALHECSDLLIRYGGHKAAAGVSFAPANLDALVEAFDAAVGRQTGTAEPEVVDEHDGAITLERVDVGFLGDVRRLAPYGMGFAPPLFLCEESTVTRTQVVAQRHLRLMLDQGGVSREAMLFGGADRAQSRESSESGAGEGTLEKGDRVSCLFTPASRRGRHTPQLRLRDIWRT